MNSKDKILRYDEVKALVGGLSNSTLRRMEIAGQFPKRLQISKQAVGWRQRDVEQWLKGGGFSKPEVNQGGEV